MRKHRVRFRKILNDEAALAREIIFVSVFDVIGEKPVDVVGRAQKSDRLQRVLSVEINASHCGVAEASCA